MFPEWKIVRKVYVRLVGLGSGMVEDVILVCDFRWEGDDIREVPVHGLLIPVGNPGYVSGNSNKFARLRFGTG